MAFGSLENGGRFCELLATSARTPREHISPVTAETPTACFCENVTDGLVLILLLFSPELYVTTLNILIKECAVYGGGLVVLF